MNWKDLALTANFPAEISCEEISRSETRITLRWEKQPYDAPALCVTWKTALKDIQYEWYPLCGRDRALRTDWDAPIHTLPTATGFLMKITFPALMTWR